jgi:2-(1,2-epoxy-1,2-dihydrophenyl)acetyl-CoA isomerase
MTLRCETPGGGVAVVTLDRPAARNALSAELRDALCETLASLAQDDAVRAAVITGAGEHFCAGGDVRSMGELDAQAVRERMDAMRRASMAVGSFPKPLVAAVAGHAAGAGVGLACLCDVVVAEESATFTLAFLRVGLGPDWGVSHALPRRIGESATLRLLLTREGVGGADAHRMGLADVLVPTGSARGRAVDHARSLAAGPPEGMVEVKRLMGDLDALDAALAREAELQCRRFASAEHREGVAAFSEKRTPDFTRI